MKNWVEPAPIAVPEMLRAAVGGHPIVAEALVRRGMTTPDAARRFLDPAAYQPSSAFELPDTERAVERLRSAIARGERILVWGDFDVDGQTATALLVSALSDLGARVTHHIPNRLTEGHGVHLPFLAERLAAGVDLLLTCDTGIAAHEAVAFARSEAAREIGLELLITDHHALPEHLPEAFAVINPMRLATDHPLHELPGVGVAYKLVEALYDGRSTEHLLDLVAVGIVADVMVQTGDTRYLLQLGLEVLRRAARPGLREIMTRAEIEPADLTESEIAFALAPRLNALGRLADANPAVALLTSDDRALIVEQVNELEGLNQKRRFLTRQIYQAAREQIEADPSLLKYAALVVAGESWHAGVAGIVASRLVEDFGCPVVVLTLHEGAASGSARSIPGCNIVEAIGSQSHLLTGFGGHAMAAGLRLPADRVFEFRRGLSGAVRDQLGTSVVEPQLIIDAYVDLAEVDLSLVEDIARLAPFGNGNPPLTLAARAVEIVGQRALGSRRDHLELRIVDAGGVERRVIWWFGDAESLPAGRFDLAFTVRPNVFNGRREVLIEWLDVRLTDTVSVTLAGAAYRVIDCRQSTTPQAQLAAVLADYPEALVWREGDSPIVGVDRHHLRPARTLIVWQPPPDPLIWRAALDTVRPETLILFGVSPGRDTPQALLTRLAGLIKYAHRHKGALVSLGELAALTSQSEATIGECVRWFNSGGPLRLTPLIDDIYRVEIEDTGQFNGVSAQAIQRRLAETRAYRAFWLKQSFD